MLAVLVIYKKRASNSETYISTGDALSASNSCLDILIFDNSPEPMFREDDNCSWWRTRYIHDPANPGVSKAYNEGFRIATEMGKKWLLLLDQDTLFPPDAFDSYCKGVAENPGIQMFAPVLRAGGRIYSPCRFFGGAGFHLRSIRYGVQQLKGRAVLNSGMLVNVAAFGECSGFDERIGLDFADFAFNKRFRRYHDSFCLLPVECSHSFSDIENNDTEKGLSRFASYCKGGRRSVSGAFTVIFLAFILLVRSLVLALRFRSPGFLAGYWRDFIQANEPGTKNTEIHEQAGSGDKIHSSSRNARISVCMATYNGERFLRRQLETILPQMGAEDELVISDDSSTDGTLELIRGVDDPRIRLYAGQLFHSPVFNFEHALKRARGELIVLADQDDIWLPGKLQIIRDSFSKEHARPYLIVLDAEVVDEDENVICPSVLQKLDAGPGFWKNLYDNRYLGCCMAFSRDLLEQALPFPQQIPMHDIWLGQLCERVGKTAFIPVVTMKYRKHRASLTDFKIEFRPLLQIRRRIILAWNLICRSYLS